MRQVSGQIDSDEIFDELCLVQNFIKENISKLNDGKTKPFERWQEVLEYLGSNKREIPNFRELPRLFSMIHDIWSDEKGQLTLPSFQAIINIKLNYRLNCL
jgi:hypothetical protein